MVRTGFPGQLEHFGSAAIATAGYGLKRSATRVIGCFWLYAGILEYLQHFSPGRHLSTYGTTGLGRHIWRNRGSTSRSAGSKEGTAPIRHPQPIMPGSPPPTRLKETPNGRPSNSPKSEGLVVTIVIRASPACRPPDFSRWQPSARFSKPLFLPGCATPECQRNERSVCAKVFRYADMHNRANRDTDC
jgi:hypothetical protein